ncbi:hypothetical protein ACFRQM_31265 [Streptomyces sp. NPDC056831]|uniref:hypothetical protein n=1 Tax=Streptomyces sp. NPDC056831 TaxID=3345954 RepID=UPI0036A8C9BB
MMLAQREMRHKPHETVHFTAALDLIADIAGAIVTADALHTVAGHARYLHRRGAFGLFPVKGNRSTLFAALDTPDWDETTNPAITLHRTEETNSGRHQIRTVRVQPLVPGQVNFPHATQALLVERYTTGRGDGKIHANAELGITTAHFYAANGWGTTALMGGLLSYWLLAIGITTYRSARRVAAADGGGRRWVACASRTRCDWSPMARSGASAISCCSGPSTSASAAFRRACSSRTRVSVSVTSVWTAGLRTSRIIAPGHVRLTRTE